MGEETWEVAGFFFLGGLGGGREQRTMDCVG